MESEQRGDVACGWGERTVFAVHRVFLLVADLNVTDVILRMDVICPGVTHVDVLAVSSCCRGQVGLDRGEDILHLGMSIGDAV